MRIYANDLPILANTYKCLRMVYKHTDRLTNALAILACLIRILHNRHVSRQMVKNHIFHCVSHISSSVMAEAVRQVATLAILVSQPTVVIHNAIVALQQYRETSRKHLRKKVTPDFHLTYIKNGGNLGFVSK